MSQHPSDSSSSPLGLAGRTVLGAYMVLLSLLLIYLVFELWPTAEADATGRIPDSTITLFGSLIEFTVSAEVQLILLVAVAAALGSYVHTATSFADYVGNRRIYTSWVWWYILRVFIGVSLALIFYFVIRGGLLSAGATADDVSPFGIAAVAGLVGMFSKQATDKLEELFNTLFMKETSDQRGDKLQSPVPQITRIEPEAVPSGAGDLPLTVNGRNFLPESVVRVRGSDRTTTFVSDTQLTALLPASDLASPVEAQVTVFNPPPGGGTSNAALLRVE